jgi:fluoride exporter
MLRIILYVAAGSSAGGVTRYLSQQFVQKHFPSSIPFGTLAVNIIGCFLIGMIYGVGEKGQVMSPEMRILLATGFCGGFTTFSSFAFENMKLMQDGEYFYMAFYIAASVVIGFLAVFLGALLIKLIF